MKCGRCGRKLKTGFLFHGRYYGPKCLAAASTAALAGALENHAAAIANPPATTPPPALKAFFMSSPRTGPGDRRTWLVRSTVDKKESFLVRVFPDDLGRTARCDCPFGQRAKRCPHVDLIAELDGRKFQKGE